MGFIEQTFGPAGDQYAALWDISIESGSGSDGWDDLQARVVDVPLPFAKLATERLPGGRVYYSGVEFPLDFSITLRETSGWHAHRYFQGWWDKVFDQKSRRFRSYVGSDPIHRQAKISFYGFASESDEETISSYFTNRPFADKIMMGEEVDNIIAGVIKNEIQSVASVLTDISRAFGGPVLSPNMPKLVRWKEVPVSAGPDSAQVVLDRPQLPRRTPQAIYAFSLLNVKLVGIEPLSLSYEGGPLSFQVSLSAEDVRGEPLAT